VDYLDFLGAVHRELEPDTYVEIGVRDGGSLGMSRTRSVAIDPDFAIKQELYCDLHLVKTTSDDYFARDDALDEFAGRPVGLGFVDGLHLFEFALRDFMNVEARSAWWSVAILDDIYPRIPVEATRERINFAWTGDVYKTLLVLQQYRPDLLLLPVHTEQTGLLVVLGLDAESRVLHDRYDDITDRFVVPDPQDVPSQVLDRVGAWDAAALADSELWALLKSLRQRGISRDIGLPQLTDLVNGLRAGCAADFERSPIVRHDPVPWPLEKAQTRPAVKSAARRTPDDG
jgi:hypothetical protein